MEKWHHNFQYKYYFCYKYLRQKCISVDGLSKISIITCGPNPPTIISPHTFYLKLKLYICAKWHIDKPIKHTWLSLYTVFPVNNLGAFYKQSSKSQYTVYSLTNLFLKDHELVSTL